MISIQRGTSGGAETKYSVMGISIDAGADSYVIQHNLNSASAKIKSFMPNWGTAFWKEAQDANSITIGFTVQAPGDDSGLLDLEVSP